MFSPGGCFRFLDLSGNGSLELTEEEKRELAAFDSKISELRGQKILKLRELAKQKGVAALELKDLKSECGKLFVKERERGNYRRAMARGEAGFRGVEFAYQCVSQYEISPGNEDSCGWVKGEPREEPYDNLGPLSGSAGTRYYCKICGKMVGELQTVLS